MYTYIASLKSLTRSCKPHYKAFVSSASMENDKAGGWIECIYM